MPTGGSACATGWNTLVVVPAGGYACATVPSCPASFRWFSQFLTNVMQRPPAAVALSLHVYALCGKALDSLPALGALAESTYYSV